MFGAKLIRLIYTSIRRRLFGRRQARRRASCDDYHELIRLQLREHTQANGGKFGQPVTNYYCKVYIGTPMKRFNIQFDLSLNDHFIPHKEKLRLSRQFKRGYSGKRSLTSEKIDQLCKLKHLDSKLCGKSYVDDVRLELYSPNKMRSRSAVCKSSRKKLVVESDREAITDDEEHGDSSSDERVLRSNSLQNGNYRNGNVKDVARDAHNIVALRMRFVAIARDPNNQYYQRKGIDGFFGLGLMHETSTGLNSGSTKKHSKSVAPQLEICFGGYERSQFEEPVYWHKSPSKKQWVLKLTSVYMGDDFVGHFNNPRHLALLTSAENEIFAPIEIVQKIYNLLNAKQDPTSGLVYVDCRAISKLPNFKISTKRMTVILEPEDYIRQVDGKCFLAIMPSGERNLHQWRLGTCFFSKIYAIFNLKNRRIGFANLTNSNIIESYL